MDAFLRKLKQRNINLQKMANILYTITCSSGLCCDQLLYMINPLTAMVAISWHHIIIGCKVWHGNGSLELGYAGWNASVRVKLGQLSMDGWMSDVWTARDGAAHTSWHLPLLATQEQQAMRGVKGKYLLM